MKDFVSAEILRKYQKFVFVYLDDLNNINRCCDDFELEQKLKKGRATFNTIEKAANSMENVVKDSFSLNNINDINCLRSKLSELEEIIESYAKMITIRFNQSRTDCIGDFSSLIRKRLVCIRGIKEFIDFTLNLFCKTTIIDVPKIITIPSEIILDAPQSSKCLVESSHKNLVNAKHKTLFCHFVDIVRIMPFDNLYTHEVYCKKVCTNYGIDYTDNIRKNFGDRYSLERKYSTELQRYLLPMINCPSTVNKISDYLSRKAA